MAGDEAVKPRADVGPPTEEEKETQFLSNKDSGTSASYLARRLKRDHLRIAVALGGRGKAAARG
jgi:hypothetical protein